MGATESWTPDHDPGDDDAGVDAIHAPVGPPADRDAPTARPWVAMGGWRRAVVGVVTGLAAGLAISRWVDRD